MHAPDNQINCPNCDHQIDVNDILYRQLSEDLRKEYESKLTADRAKLQSDRAQLETQQRELNVQQTTIDEKIAHGVQSQIKDERTKISQLEREKANKDAEAGMAILQQELKEKTDQVKELNKSRAEVSRLKREQETLVSKLEVENEQKYSAQLKQDRERITAEESNKAALQVKEQQIVINQLNSKLKEAQQKAEQGSMQLQGEAQELALEDWLHTHYPLNTIVEVKKGAAGADCVQIVNTSQRQDCGKIYYESKRTKVFQPAWIGKFKADIRDKNADIGVLVSQARPAGYDRMAVIDGIWVCNYEEFKGLCIALRRQITEIDRVTTSQENQGEKINMLWNFLQSNEFRLQVDGIVEGFTTLKSDLEKEKRATTAQWKKREKQIDKVILNTTNLYGSIKGIAGSSVQSVPALELDCD